MDIETLKRSVRYVTDERGNETDAIVPLSLWDEILSALARDEAGDSKAELVANLRTSLLEADLLARRVRAPISATKPLTENVSSRPNDEPLDLVDRGDRIVGWCWRSELRDTKPQHCRVINAFIVNDRGQLWIPRRSASKAKFPLALDMSCGGYVTRGESYETALRRELHEETGLELDRLDWCEIARISPYDVPVSAFMAVYEIRAEAVPSWNRDDFCEAFWLTPEELLDRIAAGERTKGDLPELVALYRDR